MAVKTRSKYKEVATLLEKRIRHGDYLLGGLPSERVFANETGISQMTARKAMKELEDKGLVARKENGRLVVNTEKQGFFGILIPAHPSQLYAMWRNAIKHALDKLGLKLCQIDYVHWDDPSIQDALQNLNGVFVLPAREDMPKETLERFKNSEKPVVIVGDDFTEFGLRSMLAEKYSHIQDLLDYIHSFGHKRIDCINTEPLISLDEKRLAQWRLWLASRDLEGELFNEPVKSYENSQYKARDLMLRLIDEGRFNSSALLCSSQGVALGVMRALWERGMMAGKEVSIAAMSGEDGLNDLFCPSLCSLSTPDLEPYLKICIDWMREPEKKWIGPLLVAPEESIIFKGESVGPCLQSAARECLQTVAD